MTQPGFRDDSDELNLMGSPRWYLERLTRRLLGRQTRYDKLERYALGDHPYPNGDKRYVVALRDLQRKARTNYCGLVISAVTERMKPLGFQFGPEEQIDEEAQSIWNYNDMDYQSQIIINTAATFGDAYVLVAPPIEEDGEPIISAEDPRMCITETDPRLVTKTLAGLKMWQDDADSTIRAVLYLPNEIRTYRGPAIADVIGTDVASLTKILVGRSAAAGGFVLERVQRNPYNQVTLVKVSWQPAFGSQSRAEHEGVLDIQDRINHTILDRLVISKAQAYNQRWVTGAKKGDEFKPGADMVWATVDKDAKMGQFDAADVTPILTAVKDDIGDMAAISQTPASYLMNRIVNVSGDTLNQDQAALTSKIQFRQIAVGWALERVIRMAFLIKGNTDKAKETKLETIWKRPVIYKIEMLGDFMAKTAQAGVPIDVVMQVTDLFTSDQIERSRQHAEEMNAQEMNMRQKELDNAVQVAKTGPPRSPGS